MRRALKTVLFLVALAGCRQQPLATGVTDSTFVRVMVGLRRLPTGNSFDRGVRDRSRDSILKANGVSAGQIESAAVSLASHPDRAAAIWRAIDGRAANPMSR